jgi:hypothetical protein
MVLADIMTVSFSGTEMRSTPNAMSSKVITKVSTYTPLEVLEKALSTIKLKITLDVLVGFTDPCSVLNPE